MNASRFLRPTLLASALASALSAHAVVVGLTSAGSLTTVGTPTIAIDEAVLLQQGGFGPLSSLRLGYDEGALPHLGTGVYSGSGGTLSFSVSFTRVENGGFSQAMVGTWSMTGGTGDYANKTGTGTITTNVDYSTVASELPSFTTFRGDITPVPEPASMAVLGLGAAAMLRRRKRA